MAVAATWSCSVVCRPFRRQALRAALADLPRGVTWDLVIEHQAGCECLEEWTEGQLRFCRCSILTLRATEVVR